MINKSSVFISAIFLTCGLFFSCEPHNILLTADQVSAVKDSVQTLTSNTSRDLSLKGPTAWLNYFENSSDFYMASDGGMAFTDYNSADKFIKNTLVKQFRSINLKFANMRITVLSAQYATIGADFNEELTDFSANSTHFNGYFTATAHQTSKGWKYLNMHWSIKKEK